MSNRTSRGMSGRQSDARCCSTRGTQMKLSNRPRPRTTALRHKPPVANAFLDGLEEPPGIRWSARDRATRRAGWRRIRDLLGFTDYRYRLVDLPRSPPQKLRLQLALKDRQRW